MLELTISKPKITFELDNFNAKLQKNMFSKFQCFAFSLSPQRGSYCFEQKERVAEHSDIQRSKSYEEILLAENQMISGWGDLSNTVFKSFSKFCDSN